MTEYFDRDDVLTAGSAAVGQVVQVGDYGLLDAAVARPRTTAFGLDAYPDDFTKAAALLQSKQANRLGIGMGVPRYQRGGPERVRRRRR